ncbi:hypothetical protein [Halioxenophilus sp. WMMB6]|uniref:hypothetical protein n=1 Tax=Halioxenophilus sp. WMMB6 TaxID=3073815 RepID=UPI00295EC28E|nr:hypothetical protein [Halioxenophilus sp. WMMB6]
MATANNFGLLDGALLLVTLLVIGLLTTKKIRDADIWRATVTPLASIIGSGFLVVVPLLSDITGKYSPIAVTAIVLLSFWLGSAVRFNILHEQHVAPSPHGKLIQFFERSSNFALTLAYIISVTFYLRLMSGFLLTGVNAYSTFNADILATLVIAAIGLIGISRGLFGLERLEEYSVTIKLAIIAALLLGLVHYNGVHGYDLSQVHAGDAGLWQSLRLLAGMLLIVQGFETSKYLADAYSAKLRCRTMLIAQLLAGVIYIAFVTLASPLMTDFGGRPPSETAIIEMSHKITLVLPLLLIIAAAMSQFSAAIADTIGAGGVVELESRKAISARVVYPIIALFAITLVWSSNIFEVVSLASRAFALYYGLQSLLAAALAFGMLRGWRRNFRTGAYLLLALLMLMVALWALPVAA